MRAELVMGLLVLLIAAVVAEKTKEGAENPPTSGDTYADGQPIPEEADPLHPEEGDQKDHVPHQGGHHGRKAGHHKGSKEGHHEGPIQYAGAAALKEEIVRIKESDLPDEEKKSRLQALHQHVKNSQMIQSAPPEVRARHTEYKDALRQIQEDSLLSEEERKQRIADERERFQTDMQAFKASISPEQIERMKEERRKTIEGHTAAAVAAGQDGHHQMAREYYRRAKMAAKGHPVPPKRKRSAPMKRPSLSEPDFF